MVTQSVLNSDGFHYTRVEEDDCVGGGEGGGGGGTSTMLTYSVPVAMV